MANVSNQAVNQIKNKCPFSLVISTLESNMGTKVIAINPVAKPRMTQKDRWAKRKCVLEYWAYKEELRNKLKNFKLPDGNWHITFFIKMPASWSLKKKGEHNLRPHQPKGGPDKDNLEKGFLDALFENDAHIWDGRVTKLWHWDGLIQIETK